MKTLIIILVCVTMLQSAVINNSQRKISDEEILSKWSPIFEKCFSNYRLSEENLLNISIYIEICYEYYDILGQLSNTNYDLTNVIQKLVVTYNGSRISCLLKKLDLKIF